jgi:hypothetical protein
MITFLIIDITFLFSNISEGVNLINGPSRGRDNAWLGWQLAGLPGRAGRASTNPGGPHGFQLLGARRRKQDSACLSVLKRLFHPFGHECDSGRVWFSPHTIGRAIVPVPRPFRSLDPNELEEVSFNEDIKNGIKHSFKVGSERFKPRPSKGRQRSGPMAAQSEQRIPEPNRLSEALWGEPNSF